MFKDGLFSFGIWEEPGVSENGQKIRTSLCTKKHRLVLLLVPVVGLEPTRYRYQRILSPPRLPFQHTGIFNFCTAMHEIPNIGGIPKC